VWPSVYSDQWSLAESIVREQRVGGVVLMTPSDAFAEQLGDRLTELTALGAHGLAVATDEEGGAVQRLRALEEIPSQQDMSARSVAEVTSVIERHARLIADAGIDVVLGPVVDVRPTEGDDPLGQGRLFAGDPQQVADLGALYVRAWQSAGLVPILKHFPGHGSASADTHQSLAVTPPLAALLERDLVPYRQLAGSGAGVMVGHLEVPGLTDGQAAGFSAAAAHCCATSSAGAMRVMTDASAWAQSISRSRCRRPPLQAGVDVVASPRLPTPQTYRAGRCRRGDGGRHRRLGGRGSSAGLRHAVRALTWLSRRSHGRRR
jgi:beta-N-acetylhexosaminidase